MGPTVLGMVRASGWVLLGAAVGRVATLIASLLVARMVAPDDFGKLTLMLTAITLLSGLAGMGLGLAATRQVAEARAARPDDAARYLGSVLVLTVAGGVAVSVALLLESNLFAGAILGDDRLGGLVTASAGAVAFLALNLAVQACLTGFESFRLLAFAQWLQGLATAAGLLLGADANDATGALVGFSAGQGLGAVVGILLLRRETQRQGMAMSYGLERRVLRRLWGFGLPTFIAFLVVSGALLAGQVILSHEANGYAQVAIFSLAYRWHLAIVFLPASMAPVLVPLMTRLGADARVERVSAIFRGTMWSTLALTAVPAAVTAALAPTLLGLSGRFYADHALPLVILAAAAIPAALNNVLSSTAVSFGAMREWLFSDVILGLVLVGCAAVLVGGSQATGLAVAYLAAYAATDLALIGPLRTRLRTSVP